MSAVLENPFSLSLSRRRDGETVSNALEKSNCKSIVISFLSIPVHMSSVSLIRAVCVELRGLKPVCSGQAVYFL